MKNSQRLEGDIVNEVMAIDMTDTNRPPLFKTFNEGCIEQGKNNE